MHLTCVMAARERQRGKRHGVTARRVSWPTVVLAGGIMLSLAANLAQAQPDAWGRVMAATPCGAFLVAVSMLERRATASRHHGGPASTPGLRAVPDQDGAQALPSWAGRPSRTEADTLLESARRAAAEYQAVSGQPITRDALRSRLGISNQLASDLLRQVRTPEPLAPHKRRPKRWPAARIITGQRQIKHQPPAPDLTGKTMTSDATRTTGTRHGGSQEPGTHAQAQTSPASALTGAHVRDARAQHQLPDATTEGRERARALREESTRVVALLPPLPLGSSASWPGSGRPAQTATASDPRTGRGDLLGRTARRTPAARRAARPGRRAARRR
ncbi:MAG TPA: hypothetical protein VMV92_31085, partial [Streptosporangiaceae bacterium]|nr:hypothetical protein [Streptosporangiaceae bacterium]